MQLARVIGTVVATIKSPGLEGVKLLIVQPLDAQREPVGNPVVAADAVHMAGPGELVYVVAAREAALAMPEPFVPVDHAIVGIVDAVEPVFAGAASTRAKPDDADGGRGSPTTAGTSSANAPAAGAAPSPRRRRRARASR